MTLNHFSQTFLEVINRDKTISGKLFICLWPTFFTISNNFFSTTFSVNELTNSFSMCFHKSASRFFPMSASGTELYHQNAKVCFEFMMPTRGKNLDLNISLRKDFKGCKESLQSFHKIQLTVKNINYSAGINRINNHVMILMILISSHVASVL